MLNNPLNDKIGKADILERLKHPENEGKRYHRSRNLMVRNVLNALFIILAVVAMVGIVVSDVNGNLMVWYAVGLFAVVVKMIEVVLRMPGFKK